MVRWGELKEGLHVHMWPCLICMKAARYCLDSAEACSIPSEWGHVFLTETAKVVMSDG